MGIYKNIYTICLFTILFTSCEKYLDAKSDARLSIPSTIEDLQGILDNYSMMNRSSDLLNNMTDEYYLRRTDWEAEWQLNKDSYVWDPQTNYYSDENDWDKLYQRIFYANTVLDNLEKATGSQEKLNQIKGAALCFRAIYYYQLLHLYAPPYLSVTGENKSGVVIKLTSDFNQPIIRSSVQDSYDQMFKDLEAAVKLLPDRAAYKTRPSKAAAYSYLAKGYLDLHNFEKVKEFANAALLLYDTVVDYNQVAPAFNPFERFFPETVFYLYTVNALNSYDWIAMVDSTLYKSYEDDDLRKLLYFQDAQGNGTVAFEGAYTGNPNQLFNGIATDELFLLRAEANARLNNISDAMADLNFLLSRRYAAGSFVPLVANTKEEAINMILLERRKELLNRGVRWTDLRRLNQESPYAATIRRVLDGDVFSLQPNDPRYALLIPAKVIQLSNLNQNPR
ncbi:RagB/SusD family nutrient uptake outer membrane protein [Pseudobacter ginsenosidimutans]|uniref:SusD-like starch-binding protein associating with outer membrane n=1 Tax=Pseudobacter ginsenosidimutans TaxID=661488 RepID=A0A4Q7N2K9_9BACT|nr:RagB/SusD family nutrient uptake outer membrane protein [Pseudobacter ginsenosidimutans]QEC43683.1 RagB/SusD family nutrient uptake outer membrane protein [Pseudobacter ginsenosidimutans]RZS75084.1 SusD-like starch-binding protein associating with outer membrane [Pseudobacter ginsenosidimutans]